MSGNDNRDNAGLRMEVTVSTPVRVYLLIDDRLSDGDNATPPTFDATHMQWVVDQGWTPVVTGVNHLGNPSYPDDIGIDEGGDGTINQWHSIYSKDFAAGTFALLQADNSGRNMYGVVVVATGPPSTPTNLVVINGDAKVTLTWDAVAKADSYLVKRSDTSGGPYTTVGTPTSNSLVDTPLVNGATYYYVVSALNAAGESLDSDEVIGRPNIPVTGLTAVLSNGQVTLAWDALPGAVSYRVLRGTTTGGPYTEIASGVATTGYMDTTVQGGRNYYYAVVASLGGSLESGLSNEALATTVPNAPTNVTATLFAATVITVAWTQTDPVVSQFIIEQSTDGMTFAPLTSLGASLKTYTNAGLTLGTTYFYRLQAQNASGVSDYSAVVSNATPAAGWNVNFANASNGQPANNPAPTPVGYLQDVGDIFGDRGNGFSYGWDRDITADGRWRQNVISPDLRYDTFLHLIKATPPAVWNIAIPNGFYYVHIVAGDPNNTDSVFQFDVEGVLTGTITPTGPGNLLGHWGDFAVTCLVNDGQLTITSGPDSQTTANNNKIAFVDVYPAIPVPILIAVEPPAQTTTEENHPVSLSVGITNAPFPANAPYFGFEPIFYQWYHDGNPVPDGTNAVLNFALPQLLDAGQYWVVVTNYAGSVTSILAQLNVDADVTPPTVLSAGSVDGLIVGVCFDEILDTNSPPETSTPLDPANYLINGIETPSAVTFRDSRTLNLIVTTPVTGPFTLEVTGVKDLKGNGISSPQTVHSKAIGLTGLDIGTGVVGTDAGDPPVPGSHFTCTSNEFQVVSGGSDVWGNADHFRFLYRPVSGDFDARVQVKSLTAPDTITKAILMARESTAAGSRNVHININPPAPARDQGEAGLRAATDGTTAGFGTNYIPVGIPNAYMRLTRSGDTFTVYRSTNGTDWLLFGETVASFPAEMLVGVGVTAHTTNVVAGNYPVGRGVFSGFSVVQPGADLTIRGTVQPASVLVGGNLTYTVVVSNQGPSDATAVVLTNALPAGIGYVSATSSQGTPTEAGGVVTCDLGTLAAGATATVTINALGATEGAWTVLAGAASSQQDLNPSDNSVAIPVSVLTQPKMEVSALAYSAANGGSFSGAFQTVSGVSYVVEYKNSVTDTVWTTLTTIAGDGGLKPFNDPGPLPAQRFYRLRVLQP